MINYWGRVVHTRLRFGTIALLNKKIKRRFLLFLWACGIRELSRECGQCVWVTCGRLVRP